MLSLTTHLRVGEVAPRNFMKANSVRLSVSPVAIYRTCFLFVSVFIFTEI